MSYKLSTFWLNQCPGSWLDVPGLNLKYGGPGVQILFPGLNGWLQAPGSIYMTVHVHGVTY